MIRAIGAYTLSECMDVIADLIYRAEQADENAKNVVFCEDRLTLLAERTIAEKSGGSFRTSVTTYARALKTRARVLSKQGSVVAIDGIVSALQKQKKLKLFSRGVPRGTAKTLYETIAQLAASSVDENTLKEAAELLEDGVLKNKISDLSEIYAAYAAFLKENSYVDESGYLALLPEYLKSSGEIKGANVYFLGYTSFTAQAAKTLKATFSSAANVTGVFCYGKEEFYAGAGLRAFLRAAEETFGVGAAVAVNAGTPCGGEAEALRKGIFDPSSFARGRKKYPTDRIRLFEAEDKYSEAERIAAEIKKTLSNDPSFRYRDFSVLVADTKGYTLAVKKAFSEYGIPYFLDEKRSLKSHPLSAFLLSCFEAERTDLLPDAVDAVLQNPFFGGENTDEYRNYLLKFANYRGGAKKEIRSAEELLEKQATGGESYDEATLKENRNRLFSYLIKIPKKATGRAFCGAVRQILTLADVSSVLQKTADKVRDVALKEYLGQIGGTLEKVLSEAETLLSEREMTAAEFADVLSDGLDATEISLIPVKTDAVFVGDINESRIGKTRVLFAAGLDESVPKTTADAALISDREIEKLAEVKAKTEPTVAEVNLRCRENVALNLCSFTDAAYFSYALSADGEEPALSEIIRYVQAVFCGKNGEKTEISKSGGAEDLPYRCSAFVPALKYAYLTRAENEKKGAPCGKECLSAEEALSRAGLTDGKDDAKPFAHEEFVSEGKRLFFREGKTSPSALETYFSCPFKHFMRYGLRLKERVEQAVMATDSGNFIHELLQKTAVRLDGAKTETEARALAETTGKDLLRRPPYRYGAETLSGAYAQERLLHEGVEAAAAVFRQLKGSLYRVAATEKSVETPSFRGTIDRVDVAGDFVRVVDYKTGYIDDSAATYYTGRKIQLQLYMTEAKQGKIPAGTFYFPASLSYSDEENEAFRMKGFFCGDDDAVTAGDAAFSALEQGEESAFFEVKKGGRSNSRAMDRTTFSDFVDYSLLVSAKAKEELEQGFIGVSPYKGACDFCPYGGACGHDGGKGFCRNADFTVDAKGVAGIVRAEREQAAERLIDAKTDETCKEKRKGGEKHGE